VPFGLNLISGQKVQKSRGRPAVYVKRLGPGGVFPATSVSDLPEFEQHFWTKRPQKEVTQSAKHNRLPPRRT
jgi:hypothetical protein